MKTADKFKVTGASACDAAQDAAQDAAHDAIFDILEEFDLADIDQVTMLVSTLQAVLFSEYRDDLQDFERDWLTETLRDIADAVEANVVITPGGIRFSPSALSKCAPGGSA
jgi:hypothetical protein